MLLGVLVFDGSLVWVVVLLISVMFVCGCLMLLVLCLFLLHCVLAV